MELDQWFGISDRTLPLVTRMFLLGPVGKKTSGEGIAVDFRAVVAATEETPLSLTRCSTS